MDGIYRKPWGWEFEACFSNSFSLWILCINPNNQTSLHCHVKKTTGYIVLEGKVEIEFLSSKLIIGPGDSINLRPGVFHRTRALDDKAFVLEIESPNDKDDLLRLEDGYERNDSLIDHKDMIYDQSLIEFQLLVKSNLDTKNSIGIQIGSVYLKVIRDSITHIMNNNDWGLISLLEGKCPLKNSSGGVAESSIFSTGHISKVDVLRRMAPVLNFENECLLLVAKYSNEHE